MATIRDNLIRESARADKNAAALMTAALASLPLIEAAIMADERGCAFDPEHAVDAKAWRDFAMQTLGILRATLTPNAVD
jgi:hypothetical protein